MDCLPDPALSIRSGRGGQAQAAAEAEGCGELGTRVVARAREGHSALATPPLELAFRVGGQSSAPTPDFAQTWGPREEETRNCLRLETKDT